MATAPSTEKEQDKMVRMGAYGPNTTRVDPWVALIASIGQDRVDVFWFTESARNL